MTTKEIIEKVCKDNNLTFRMLATVTGLPEQYIYDINNGKIKKITAHKVSAFTKVFPQYPAMWLMTGNDDLLPSTTNVSSGDMLSRHNNITNVNVDMGDSIHHNSAPVVARGANKTPVGDIIAEKDRQIEKLEAEIQSLKEQVSDLTKSILNITTKNFKP